MSTMLQIRTRHWCQCGDGLLVVPMPVYGDSGDALLYCSAWCLKPERDETRPDLPERAEWNLAPPGRFFYSDHRPLDIGVTDHNRYPGIQYEVLESILEDPVSLGQTGID